MSTDLSSEESAKQRDAMARQAAIDEKAGKWIAEQNKRRQFKERRKRMGDNRLQRNMTTRLKKRTSPVRPKRKLKG